MTLPLLVGTEVFETWASRPVSDLPRAEAIISAASTLVRTYTGRSWVDAAGDVESDVTELQLDAVRSVVLRVAERVYFNPSGDTQESVTNYSRSVSAWYSLGMVLSDDEKAQLPLASGARPGLWTQATTRCENDLPDIYLDVAGSTEPIPHAPRGYPW